MFWSLISNLHSFSSESVRFSGSSDLPTTWICRSISDAKLTNAALREVFGGRYVAGLSFRIIWIRITSRFWSCWNFGISWCRGTREADKISWTTWAGVALRFFFCMRHLWRFRCYAWSQWSLWVFWTSITAARGSRNCDFLAWLVSWTWIAMCLRCFHSKYSFSTKRGWCPGTRISVCSGQRKFGSSSSRSFYIGGAY